MLLHSPIKCSTEMLCGFLNHLCADGRALYRMMYIHKCARAGTVLLMWKQSNGTIMPNVKTRKCEPLRKLFFFFFNNSRNIQSERLNSINKFFELTHCAIVNKAKQHLLYFLIWVSANLQPFVKQKGRTPLYLFLSVLVYQNKQPLLIHPRNLERWIVVMMNAADLQSPIMLTKGSFSFGIPGCSLCKNRWLATRIDYLQILRPFR